MNLKKILLKYWKWMLLFGLIASGCYISAWNYVNILRSNGTDLVAEIAGTKIILKFNNEQP